MSDLYELSVGFNFDDDSDLTEDKIDKLAQALMSLEDTAKGFGVNVGVAMSGAAESASDLENSMVLDAESIFGSGTAAALVSRMAELRMGTDEVAAAARRGASGWTVFIETMTPVAFEAGKLVGALEKVQGGIEGFSQSGLGATMTTLEDATYKMAVGFGQGGDRAQYMRSEMLQMVSTTQFSIGEITKLSQGLAKTGRGIDEFGAGVQANMISLENTFGVSGEKIAEVDRTMNAFGGSLEGTLDEAAMFQKQFQVPGVFENLPGIVGHAQKSMVEFGTAVVGSGQRVMGNVTKTAGVFAKAYGKTMAEAINDAQSAFDRFARVAKTNRRVFLGLADDFDPLQNAMMEVGIPLWQSSRLIEQATSDSETAVVDFVGSMRAKLASINNAQLRNRFLEQLRDELPPAVMEGIENLERYEQMQDSAAEAQRRQALASAAGTAAFEEVSDEMLNTTKELRAMWFNVKQLVGATLIQTGVMDALKDAFRGAKDVVGGFAGDIERFVSSPGFKEWAANLKPIVTFATKSFLLLGAAFGGVATSVATLLSGKASLWAVGKAAGGMGKAVGKVGETLGGPFAKATTKVGGLVGGLKGIFGKAGEWFTKGFGKRILKGIPVIGTVISAVDAVITAFQDMRDVMSDPNATGMEKFSGLLRGTVKGVFKFFDNILLGIPSFIAGVFFPEMEQSFDEGWAALGEKISNFSLTSAFSNAWNSAKQSVIDFRDELAGNIVDWRSIADEWGNDLGRAIGGMGRFVLESIYGLGMWVADGIKGLFADSGPAMAEGIEVSGYEAQGAFGDIIGNFADIAFGAFAQIGEGMLNAFGTSGEEVGIGLQIMLAGVWKGFIETFAAIGEFVIDTWEFIKAGGIGVWSGLDMLLIQPLAAGMEWAAGLLTNKFDIAFASMKAAGLGFVAAFGPSLIGVVNEAVEAVKLLVGTANLIPGMRGSFDDVLEGIDTAQAGMQKFITDAPAAATAAATELTKLKEQGTEDFETILMRREKQSADLLKSRLDSIRADDEARQEEMAAWREKQSADTDLLYQQLEGAAQKREAAEKRQSDARDFERVATSHVEQALQGMEKGEDFKGLNAQSARMARESMSDYMDTTISTLSRGLKQGTISLEEAMSALADAKVQGVKDAIAGAERAQAEAAGRRAGEVSKSAKGEDGWGIGPAQLRALAAALPQFARTGGGTQEVRVTLKGTGLAKALERDAAVEHMNNGN